MRRVASTLLYTVSAVGGSTRPVFVRAAHWINRFSRCFLGLFMALLLSFTARATTLSPELQCRLVKNASTSGQTVELKNTYSAAVPVCTCKPGSHAGTHPYSANPSALTRIRNITSPSLDQRIQGWENAAACVADVHCVVATHFTLTFCDENFYS